jgi:prolyl oligopeptidase
VLTLAIGWASAQTTVVAADRIAYPSAERIDVVDEIHGVKVADAYRWLEEDVRKSKRVAEWVEAENKVTTAYLEAIPERESIRRRLTELWNFPQYGAPFKEGGRYFYLKNDGLQNQSVLYTADSRAAMEKARVLLDPNTWSKDGTVALAALSVSDDGKYLAYCVAEAGSDWNTWRVMEIDAGRVLPDEVRWSKHSGAAWTKDGKGFFYGRYPEPEKGAEFQGRNLNQRLYYHRLGLPQSDDVLVYARPDHPEWLMAGTVSDDGRYLVVTMAVSTDDRFRVTVKDLAEPYSMPVDLIDNFDHEYTYVGNDGPVFYFKTDVDAPRCRVVAIDLRRPQREHWREVIPQADETLIQVSYVGNLLVASYLKDVKPLVKIYSPDGQFVRDVDFPAIGSVVGFQGKPSDTETFYVFSSFATPPSIYRYDMISGRSELLRRPETKFNPDDYEVKQVFYTSKDGARVPMFISHKKGLKIDGECPTLLYGYGGFNISLSPMFSVSRVAWMEMGGVYAQANLRGGGEYGEPWHKAGTKLRKQNVFDDFIAAAEWLIANGYTRRDKLAIQGGSNGGLLVGAVMTQRPELFGACLPAVGVMDMLRFHKFTGGRLWTDDYGSADNPQEFKALLAYSPYHNLRPGTRYPATLVTTADTDDRVVPGHSFKFAAELQHDQAGDAPVLIRIESRAGHGAGKPTAKRIAETADQWAFLVKNLGMKVDDPR